MPWAAYPLPQLQLSAKNGQMGCPTRGPGRKKKKVEAGEAHPAQLSSEGYSREESTPAEPTLEKMTSETLLIPELTSL